MRSSFYSLCKRNKGDGRVLFPENHKNYSFYLLGNKIILLLGK